MLDVWAIYSKFKTIPNVFNVRCPNLPITVRQQHLLMHLLYNWLCLGCGWIYLSRKLSVFWCANVICCLHLVVNPSFLVHSSHFKIKWNFVLFPFWMKLWKHSGQQRNWTWTNLLFIFIFIPQAFAYLFGSIYKALRKHSTFVSNGFVCLFFSSFVLVVVGIEWTPC